MITKLCCCCEYFQNSLSNWQLICTLDIFWRLILVYLGSLSFFIGYLFCYIILSIPTFMLYIYLVGLIQLAKGKTNL